MDATNFPGVGVSPRRVGTTPTNPTLNSPVFAHADPTPTPEAAQTIPTPARDPLLLTPAIIHPLDIATPSPYAILPTPESVLGIDSSLTRHTPSSIGTTTPWSAHRQNTPDTFLLLLGLIQLTFQENRNLQPRSQPHLDQGIGTQGFPSTVSSPG